MPGKSQGRQLICWQKLIGVKPARSQWHMAQRRSFSTLIYINRKTGQRSKMSIYLSAVI
jgi:hypothetical protein